MILSTRFKESFKTALAMAITFGIALWMDWDKPYWAGFAVAVISLATVGQSLNKGAMRMFGTLVAVAVALTLISLFPQNRWPFMAALSIYVGFCTYMMAGPKLQYFWKVCGFVAVIICLDAGPDAVAAFDIAVLRAQETGLGILVYSLVTVLVWPSNSYADFITAARGRAATQHQLYRAYLALLHGQGNAEAAQALRTRQVAEQSRFGELLDAAETDSYEVWELRHQWRRCRNQAVDLSDTMERWRQSFVEVQALNLKRLLPNLDAFCAELDGRLAQIERMLDGQVPTQNPKDVKLTLNKTQVRRLSHFHKAALALTRGQLLHLEHLSRSLFETIRDIKGFRSPGHQPPEEGAFHPGFILDTDRIASVVHIMATLWLAYLVWIYINDIPGGTSLVTMAAAIGMTAATRPQMPVSAMFMPVTVGVFIGSVLYIFVMPQLSSFAGLGLMIFAVTFALCYLYAAPSQALGRTWGLIMFVLIISVSNQQTYSFLSVTNTALMFPVLFVILMITAHIPFSPQPERAFQRHLGRFFRSGEYLLSTMHWDPDRTPTRFDRWKKAFHQREIATLPQKLIPWSKAIDTDTLRRTSPQQLQALVTSLEGLSHRVHELVDARANPQADFLVEELLDDLRTWRLRVQDAFETLLEDPSSGRQDDFRDRLSKRLTHLEHRIEQTMNKARKGQVSEAHGENFYRLLGALRGVSEALVEFAGNAGAIDWVRLREARF